MSFEVLMWNNIQTQRRETKKRNKEEERDKGERDEIENP